MFIHTNIRIPEQLSQKLFVKTTKTARILILMLNLDRDVNT